MLMTLRNWYKAECNGIGEFGCVDESSFHEFLELQKGAFCVLVNLDNLFDKNDGYQCLGWRCIALTALLESHVLLFASIIQILVESLKYTE